ncbi:MAG TPA: acetylornithine deacetylase [Rhizobiales bacterium]|nr:acetylornithine deacetylase [Hyphomicrobiales bacterium]
MDLLTHSTIDILASLVEFNTVSSNSNLELVSFVQAFLETYGVRCNIQKNETGTKASILASIGPKVTGGIILSAHTDVVPVEGQNWSNDPFSLLIKGQKAYGRGTCDMKGFMASTLAAVPKFMNAKLPVPIHLAYSYDEEVGCAGVGPLIDCIISLNLEPALCIVGEPTNMETVSAHTGKQIFKCIFLGTPIHSSFAPSATNAISLAGDIIHKLNQFSLDLKSCTTGNDRFPISHPTINIGQIEGGTAPNIVAKDCSFLVEYRYPPKTPQYLLRDKLDALFANLREDQTGRYEEIISYPAFLSEANTHALRLINNTLGTCEPLAVNYGTEAGLYAAAGIDTIVLGPGDIRQAHQPDEYIELSQLEACDLFLDGLIHKLSVEGLSQ